MLLALLACAPIAVAPQGGDEPLPRPETTRVEVLRGRAVVVHGGRPERTLGSGEHELTAGRTHLEVGAGAEARVLWAGRASLQVWGPASLQWDGALALEFFDLSWADLETRRGALELRLPGDWRARVSVGALHLRGLPSGPVELRLHAGQPIPLDWLGDKILRPPVTVYAGSSVRLDPPTKEEGQKKRNVDAWDRVEWPWRRPADTPEQVRERLRVAELHARKARGTEPWPAPAPGEESARVPEFQGQPTVTVDVRAAPVPPPIREPALEPPTRVPGELPGFRVETEPRPDSGAERGAHRGPKHPSSPSIPSTAPRNPGSPVAWTSSGRTLPGTGAASPKPP